MADPEKALAPTTNVACPLSLVVVENWLASSSPTRAVSPSTRPLRMASSLSNSLMSFLSSSVVSVTRSRQAFKSAAASNRLMA